MHNAGMEVPDNEFFELRQQAGYWRAQQARAVQRASVWEARAAELEGIVHFAYPVYDV